MNINELLKKLKESLGLTKYLKTSYDDKALYDIIVTHALRDWSYYFKYELDLGLVEFNNDNIINNDIMALPPFVVETCKRSNVQIEDVKSINFKSSVFDNAEYLFSIYPANRSYMSTEQLYAGQRMAEQQGDIDLYKYYRYSCWFEKPNLLRFNYPIVNLTLGGHSNDMLKSASLSLYTTLSPNLVGIAPGKEAYFFKLCRLHIMKVIYENEIKYMESLNTGAGTLNLKVDEWSQSGSQLEELLKQLEEFSTLSQQGAVTV